MSGAGTLHIVGLGPGDPDLVTLRAARLLGRVAVIAYLAKGGRAGHARTSAAPHLAPGVRELRFDYPVTTEIAVDDPVYAGALAAFYDATAAVIAEALRGGEDVALLCEGDPFFYGSAMYLHDRLAGAHRCEVTPGVAGMCGCWAASATPMLHGDDVFAVLPGTLEEASLAAHLARSDAAVVMKLGRNLAKVRRALARAGRLDGAVYVERGTMAGERIAPLAELGDGPAPYFSLILLPGRRGVR